MHTVLSSLSPAAQEPAQRPQNLKRTAQTVELFLNALRLPDEPARTEVEEALVRWLVDGPRMQEDHLIYQQYTISCHSRGHITAYYDVLRADQTKTLWCNGRKLSAIDATAFNQNVQLVMLGTEGLDFTLPKTGTQR